LHGRPETEEVMAGDLGMRIKKDLRMEIDAENTCDEIL